MAQLNGMRNQRSRKCFIVTRGTESNAQEVIMGRNMATNPPP